MDILWRTYLILIFISSSKVLTRSDIDGTVTGCDGYACSVGVPSNLPLTSDKGKAILLARCQAKCLETYGQALDNSKVDCEDHANVTCNDIRGCYGALGFSECRTECSNKKGCRTGCLNALPQISGNLPVTPESSINITRQQEPRSNSPGIFDVLSYEVPQNNTTTQPRLTNFLIQLNTSSGSYFYLQVIQTPSMCNKKIQINIIQDTITGGSLNLGYCACQTAKISFAAVTSAGPSMFSPVTSVCIHGRIRYPILNSSSIKYTVQLDGRNGYESHVLINISWDKPEEFYLVTHYVIEFRDYDGASHKCRSMNVIQPMLITFPHFEFAANFTDEVPKLNCKYIFLIDVLPRREPNPIVITVDTHAETFLPKINLTCAYDCDIITGLVTANVNWIIEDKPDTLVLLNATSSFKVSSRGVVWNGNPDSTITGIFSEYPDSYVASSHNVSAAYSYKLRNVTLLTKDNHWIRIEIIPQLKAGATFRNLFSRVHCDIRPVPREPSAINAASVIVEEFTIESNSFGQLKLALTWNMPDNPYGKIENYQIRVLRQNKSDEEVTSTIIVLLTSETQTISSEYTILKDNIYLLIPEDTPCLYAQIRAKNTYMWGPWSDKVALVRFPNISPNCQIIPTIDPKTKQLNSDVRSGMGVAIFAALGIAILAKP